LNFQNQKKFGAILEHDQCTAAKKGGRILEKYSEKQIDFPPTYKYTKGTNEFNLTEPAHKRNPAYTDRIYFSDPNQAMNDCIYDYSSEFSASDHKPVYLYCKI